MSHFAVAVITPPIADAPVDAPKDNVETIVERALAPFHEFECTGRNDEYVVDVDITEKVRAMMAGTSEDTGSKEPQSLKDALEWYGLEERIVRSEDEVRRGKYPGDDSDDDTRPASSTHKYGFAIVRGGEVVGGELIDDTNAELVRAVDRTNPNSHWDWYQIGGRWNDYLLLKVGVGVGLAGDAAVKGSPSLLASLGPPPARRPSG